MDEATLELIAGLCMRAGALMEDRSADLACALPSDAAVVQQRIAVIEQAGKDILAFAAAARALHRLSESAGPAE